MIKVKVRQLYSTKKVPLSLLILILFVYVSLEGDSLSVGYLRFALYGLWIFMVAIEDLAHLKKAISNKVALAAFGYVTWRTFLSLCNCDSAVSVIGMGLNLLTFFSGTVIVPYYIKSKSGINWLFKVCTIFYLYYCIKGIVFYTLNPEAARLYSAHEFDTTVAGGYGLGFGVALITVYLWGIFLRQKEEKISKKCSILILILVLGGIYLCYLIRSTIILLSVLIGIIYQFIIFSRTIKRQSKRLCYTFIAFSLIAITAINWKDIAFLMTSANEVERNATTDRMTVIGEYLLYGTESVAITGRTNLYGEAIRSVLQNPILGQAVTIKYEDMSKVMDGHSAILDPFGAYGLIGGILCFLVYWRLFKSMLYRKRNHISGVVLTWLIFAFLNPISQSSAGCLIFIMLPILDIHLMNRSQDLAVK